MSNYIKEVIVVEGNHDKAKIQSVFPNVDVMITNGAEVSRETLESLAYLSKERGLILMLDPDYPGERIRRKINEYIGETKHIFLPKHQCIDETRRKVGIEHASKENIYNALMFHVKHERKHTTILKQDLYDRNLIGNHNSKQLRRKLTEAFSIGYCNGKTLHKKLNMFAIELTEVDEVLK